MSNTFNGSFGTILSDGSDLSNLPESLHLTN